MLALVPWLLYVTWVEPLAFRMQLGVAAEVMQQNSVSRFAVWSSRTRDLLGGFRLFVLGAAVVPVAFVIVASSRQSRSLLLAGLGAVCLQVFIVRGVIDGQTHLVVTFAFLLAAAVGVLEAKAHHLPSLRRWLAVLGVLFLLNGLTVPGARAYVACRQWSSRSPTEFARQWANVIPSNATVAGPAYSFYAAIQHNGSFRSIIPLFPGKDPRFLTYTRALCRAKLDYAVFPAGLQPSRYLSEDCAPYYQPVAKIRMPKAPIPGLAVESFDSDVYRRVEPQPAPFKPRTAASVSHVPDE
jgi:hypothetical protein